MQAHPLPKPEFVSIVRANPLAAIFCPLYGIELLQIFSAMLAVVPFVEIPPLVELHLVDDHTIAALNEQHMGCMGPTNILTFPGDRELPAALFLSTECLKRECFLHAQNPVIHLVRLLAHGCGHLSGLDHGEEMYQIEEKCMAAASEFLHVHGIARHHPH